MQSYNTEAGLLQDGDHFFQKYGAGVQHQDGGFRGISQDAVTITSAQLLALNATPQVILPAPGAGLAIVPRVIELFLDYNSVAYDGIAAGEDLVFRYTNGSGNTIATVEATGFLDATADARRVVVLNSLTLQPVANAALVLHMSSGEIATGNSPLRVKLHEYDLITLQA